MKKREGLVKTSSGLAVDCEGSTVLVDESVGGVD